MQCGVEGPHRFFNPSAGGVLCASDKLPGSATPAAGDRPSCSARCSSATGPSSHAADPRHLREASNLVAAYLAWHLERGLRSMAYVER